MNTTYTCRSIVRSNKQLSMVAHLKWALICPLIEFERHKPFHTPPAVPLPFILHVGHWPFVICVLGAQPSTSLPKADDHIDFPRPLSNVGLLQTNLFNLAGAHVSYTPSRRSMSSTDHNPPIDLLEL